MYPLFHAATQAGDGKAAWQLWQDISTLRPDTALVTAMLKALGSAGMIDEAMTVFRACVWGPRRCRPNRRTFVTLMRACREAGALREAFVVYQGMRSAGMHPDNKQFQQLLAACADVVVDDSAGRNARGFDVEREVYPALYAAFLQGPVDLDLHGLSVREARVAVLTVLRAAMHAHKRGGKGRRAAHLDDLVIITGAGQHSGEQGPKLRDEILRCVVVLCGRECTLLVQVASARVGDRGDAGPGKGRAVARQPGAAGCAARGSAGVAGNQGQRGAPAQV